MIEPKNPSEIAREALKSLVVKHLPPTPANFQASYNEIAGLPNVAPFPEPSLRQLALVLNAASPAETAALAGLDQAIGRRSWQGVTEGLGAFVEAVRATANQAEVREISGAELLAVDAGFAAKLADLVEAMLPAFGCENPGLLEQAQLLLQALRQPEVDQRGLLSSLDRFARQVSFAGEEQKEVKESLLKLMHLLVENVGALSIDDSWLKGQVDGLLAVMTPPLTLRHLDDMERRLRDVMDKQDKAKGRSVAAREEMHAMLSTFISRLAAMHDSSQSFQEKIEESARKLVGVERIEELGPLIREVIEATHFMVDETAQARNMLSLLQSRVEATEAELVQLHMELDSASLLARHDPLTDVLNRKGLDDALVREIATVQRKGSLLPICVLDIDDFKRLNDRLGHEAGDKALIHLAEITRNCMRPTDTLARYGGEEFVILMPDTSVDVGIDVMTRLQRELTKAFFLAGNERILITFSAGVAQLLPDENGSDAINRADQAMYLAKRAGKNRVMGA